jgi:hypothetical protein
MTDLRDLGIASHGRPLNKSREVPGVLISKKSTNFLRKLAYKAPNSTMYSKILIVLFTDYQIDGFATQTQQVKGRESKFDVISFIKMSKCVF